MNAMPACLQFPGHAFPVRFVPHTKGFLFCFYPWLVHRADRVSREREVCGHRSRCGFPFQMARQAKPAGGILTLRTA